MGVDKRTAVDRARWDIARAISRAVRTVARGIGKRTAEECQTAFAMPQKEAPLWAHAALRLSGNFVTSQGQEGGRQQAQLAVVVVSQAPSVEAWQQQADAFKASRAIEAVASLLPAKSSKDS